MCFETVGFLKNKKEKYCIECRPHAVIVNNGDDD